MMDRAIRPISGIYQPNKINKVIYGPDCVKEYLLSCLPSAESQVFIVTGSSLARKTPLIKQVEEILTSVHHAGTFSDIKQHAPIAELSKALDELRSNPKVDAVISIGGGSPIDSAKTLSYRFHETYDRYLSHIAIPTTLGAAECTHVAGTTMEDGVKQAVGSPELIPSYILYDPNFALHTPPTLFMSTGIRALDHAVEIQYNQTASWYPCRALALQAISTLHQLLPEYHKNPKDTTTITALFLAAYGSLGSLGQQMKGPLGLSHTIGYALGSPYGIPHGMTSCMTLGHVVKLKARLSVSLEEHHQDAQAIAAILPFFGLTRSRDDLADSEKVGDCILQLVRDLGLHTTLTQWKVQPDQVDVICDRALGVWMPGEKKKDDDQKQEALRKGVREIVQNLF